MPLAVSRSAALGTDRERGARCAGGGSRKAPFLDLVRAIARAGWRPSVRKPAIRRPDLTLGLALSLALHLSPLVFLLSWRGATVEAPPPIPVQLVIERPPPPPAAPAEAEEKPPRGRLASEEIGDKSAEPGTASGEPPSEARQDAPPDRRTQPEPKPEPRREPQAELKHAANFVQPQQEPMLLAREALALPAPEIEPLPQAPAPPPSRQPAPRPTPRPATGQHAALAVGPPAARDEYLAYLVTLVRPYLRLLSPDIVNGRHGTTSLAIRVLGDGTIARISILHSSGYPDIDARVMQIVASVGRFPPLPPWIDQPSWDINFHLRFPIPTETSDRG